MARTNSWTESAQPENQYTFGQYAFTVGAFLFAILFLVGLLVWFLWPVEAAKTQVFVVRSDVGELRAIAYQQNDFATLNETFADNGILNLQPFNERQSFDTRVIEPMFVQGPSINASALIVYCSAIGDVEVTDEGSRPVLLSTGDGENIPIDTFLKSCVDCCDAPQVIIVLDCGHDYSNTPDVLNDEDQAEPRDDFNHFVEAVGKLVNSQSLTEKPFAVITSTDVGEVPLHSVKSRKTLFGMAMQDALSRRHGNTKQFHQSLVDYCYRHGGESAQTPQLFLSGVVKEEKSIAKLDPQPIDPDAPTPDKPPEEVPGIITNLKSRQQLDQLVLAWAEHENVLAQFEKKELLVPEQFATDRWDEGLMELAEKTTGIWNGAALVTTGPGPRIRAFNTSRNKNLATEITRQHPNIIPSNEPLPPGESPATISDRTSIARAFATWHRVKLRMKYYTALYETLSWIDSGIALDDLGRNAIAINDLLNEGLPLFDDNSANLAELDRYRAFARRLDEADDDARASLEGYCQYANSRHGVTREMTFLALFNCPLIENGPEFPPPEPSAWHRRKLLERLANEGPGVGVLMKMDARRKNAQRRIPLLKSLQKIYLPSDRNLALRPLEAVAWYFGPGPSLLDSLNFVDRPVVFNALAAKRDSLLAGSRIAELAPSGTLIDLGLETNTPTGAVNFSGQFIPPDAPFRIEPVDGGRMEKTDQEDGSFRILDSRGKFRVVATETTTSDNADLAWAVNVKIDAKYRGETFQSNNMRIPIAIALRLPNEDRISLAANLDGETVTGQSSEGEVTLPIRPWANRAMPLRLSVTHTLHRGRSMQATLYPCADIADHPILPGAIDDSIQQATRRGLASLTPIARSAPIDLAAAQGGQSTAPVTIQWAAIKPADAAGGAGDAGAATGAGQGGAAPNLDQGLLCRLEELVDDKPSGEPHDFWIPVFPTDQDFLARKEVIVRNGDVRLLYEKNPRLENIPMTIACSLDGKTVLKSATLREPSGEMRLMSFRAFQAANERGLRRKQLLFDESSDSGVDFLHIDIEGWPRKYSYTFDAGQFPDANATQNSRYPNIEFFASKIQAEPLKLKPVKPEDRKVRSAFGYREDLAETLTGTLHINCDVNRHFRFPDSRDFAEVNFGNNDKVKFHYPRSIATSIQLNKEQPEVLGLECRVSDHAMVRQLTSEIFDIDPLAFQFGDTRKDLSNQRDVTRIIFDITPPATPSLEFDRRTVQTKQPVKFNVFPIRDAGGGVGTTDDKFAAVTARIFNPADQKTKLLRLATDGTFLTFIAGEPGDYELRVRVKDRLGNESREAAQRFSVVGVPVPVAPKEKPKGPPPKKKEPPKPKTDVLIVKVRIASSPLTASQEPEIEIKPDDGAKMDRTGPDTFEFSGLAKGLEYTVSGKFKMDTGFKLETEGTTKWEFKSAKEAPTTVTKTRILILKPK